MAHRNLLAAVCVILAGCSPVAQAQSGAGSENPALPWNREPASQALPPRPAATARELFVNVDDSELDNVVDGQPLDASDEETLDRILYRLPALRLDVIERLAQQDVSWQQLTDAPRQYRLEVFQLTGRVTSVARETLLPEVAARLEFEDYFRVTMQLDDAPYPVLVCSRKIPLAWQTAESLDERASAYGLFIKVGDSNEAQPQLVFAAPRVAWHPDHVAPAVGIEPEHVLLGELGFDVGLLDDVRQTNFREVTGVDRECFYQMLAAVGRAEPGRLLAGATREFSLIDLLRKPKEHHGELAMLEGVARRVTKILVNDRDIQQRFQIDHYYQIDLLYLLGDKAIRMDSADSEQTGPTYYDIYPVTVCVLRLPPGWTEDTSPRELVRMPAFFFKLWSYKSDYVSAVDVEAAQRSPMLMALEPVVVPKASTTNPAANVAIIALVLTFAGLWFGYLRQSRRDTKSKRDGLARNEPEKSLNEMDLRVQDKPDFSGWK